MLAEAWAAATAAVASAYGVEAELLRAESRGRGPRPPARVREPKKLAMHLTVVLSGCSYAELGQATGHHKDTVASHCEDVRGAILADDAVEAAAAQVEGLARAHLELRARTHAQAARGFASALEAAAQQVGDTGGGVISSVAHPTLFAASSVGLTARAQNNDHEAVIVMPGRTRA